MRSLVSNETMRADVRTAPLITLVSASGGVGKSTLALLFSYLAARQSLRTALLEADLQFGDMGFWLGMDVGLPNLSQGTDCPPITISDALDLYKAPVLPEIAEEVSDEVGRLLPTICAQHELVIADTGQFWSGLTGELICASDLILVVVDRREASIYGAIKALELCRRLGAPLARIGCLYNRCSGKARSERDRVRDALGIDDVFCISDGNALVESLMNKGDFEQIADGDNPLANDLRKVLAALLPRVGCEFAPSPGKKRGRLFA